MNEFELDVQTKKNDFSYSVTGFIWPFLAFSTIFVIATIFDVVNNFN